VGLRAGLDMVTKKKIPVIVRNRFPVVQPVVTPLKVQIMKVLIMYFSLVLIASSLLGSYISLKLFFSNDTQSVLVS